MTKNHDYATPSKGTADWHTPLNANFETIDTDVEVRDASGNRSSNDPKSGAKFLATDTGVVSLGDGSSWSETLALLRYSPPSSVGDAGSVVAGHPANSTSAAGATISGGGQDGNLNTITHDYGTIGGGWGNEVSGDGGTVSGGEKNTAGAINSVVGGGWQNETTGGNQSTVGGGGKNEAGNTAATVAGGYQNKAVAYASTVPGGEENRASGTYSLAAGRGAKTEASDGTTHDGAFVWGDSSGTAARSEATDQVLFQATGGFVAATQRSGNGDANNVRLGHASNAVKDSAVGATISGGGFDDGSTVEPNEVYDDYATIGGGRGNQVGTEDSGGGIVGEDPPSAAYATVSGGRGNTATGDRAAVAGGGSYTENDIEFSGNSASGDGAFVGGGSANTASGRQAAVAGGGGYVSTTLGVVEKMPGNTASGARSFVGGGANNTASGARTVVGGGFRNTASATNANVGGGSANTASGNSATVAGGIGNSATVDRATVAGGGDNTASGEYATVPGGESNAAKGDHSFAAGRKAEADANGAFVWGDGSDNAVTSTNANEFKVQAGDGVVFYSSSDLSHGVNLDPGEGSWDSNSSRALKTDIDSVEPGAVLSKVERLDVSTWEYDSESDATHMGPMAEDFYAAFGLGVDDEHISTVDADGVAFAAIQGLAERVEDQNDTIESQAETIDDQSEAIDRLRAENEGLRNRLERVEQRLSELDPEVGDATAGGVGSDD